MTAARVGRAAVAAIDLDDLSLSHRRHSAVRHLSGSIVHGTLTAIVGPNGAGKTSLMEAIAGRIAPAAGRLRIDPALRRSVAYLPQQAAIDRSFPLGVLDVVMLGLWARLGALRGAGAPLRERALEALAAVGLAGFERRLIGELSSGQMQRVLFARVLLQEARLILLDEPFTAVDARTTADLLTLVARWHAAGRTVVAVLHDLDQVRRHFPQTLLLAREAVAWGPTAQALSEANLARARRMAGAWDEPPAADATHRSAAPIDAKRTAAFQAAGQAATDSAAAATAP